MENKGIKRLLYYNKPTDMELWFKSFLVGLETSVDGNSVYYEKNNETLFELYDRKNGETPLFFVHFEKIWLVFYDSFGLNHTETQTYIKNMVHETLNLLEVTPFIVLPSAAFGWMKP